MSRRCPRLSYRDQSAQFRRMLSTQMHLRVSSVSLVLYQSNMRSWCEAVWIQNRTVADNVRTLADFKLQIYGQFQTPCTLGKPCQHP